MDRISAHSEGRTKFVVIHDKTGAVYESFGFALYRSVAPIPTGKNLDEASHSKLVVTMNRAQADQADTLIFATDNKQRGLVARYLRKPTG